MSISLARGLTASALVEYLQADAKLAPLAPCLADDSVNGDVLIDAIKGTVYFSCTFYLLFLYPQNSHISSYITFFTF